jgi:glutathionyl-hydroquinone reductase
MANMINGKITNDPMARLSAAGEFERPSSLFRDSPSIKDISKGRYHLYVSYACPWAHRTLIMRNLKKLQDFISFSVTDAYMGENGWTFSNGTDPKLLADIYVTADKNYTGRITVPVLWDKKEKTILNNESADIIRILNALFDDLTDSTIDLYPDHLQAAINQINEKVYKNVNNGVYMTGFASSQRAYEVAFDKLFDCLDELDDLLGRQKFLVGHYMTEADIRLFTTLIRFDPVYYGHFKCNKKRIKDYQYLYPYMKQIFQMPEVKSTCRFDHIKEHYYKSHTWINPTKIVPKGPEMELDSPHDRGDIRFWLRHH